MHSPITTIKEALLIKLKKWNKNVIVSKRIDGYLENLNLLNRSEALTSAYSAIKNLPNSSYQTPLNEVAVLEFFIKAINAKNILEIGTYKGFTALCFAIASEEDAHVHTCEISPDNVKYAKDLWASFNVANKITIHEGPAVTSMEKLAIDNNKFDFIYIDANKNQYIEYYDLALKLAHPGTILVVDNAIWAGLVAEPHTTYSHAELIKNLNRKAYESGHKGCAFIPAWDGALLILV
jgi:caffeoyl-CoA O-methyltransferase